MAVSLEAPARMAGPHLSSPNDQGMEILRQRPRLVTAGLFAGVGLTGLVVNQMVLWALVTFGGVNYLLSAIAATQGSTTWNFVLNDRWVFAGREGSAVRRYLSFSAVNNSALVLRVPLLALLTSAFGIHYLLSNLITLVLLFGSRFLVSERLIWKQGTPERGREGAASSKPPERDVSGNGHRTVQDLAANGHGSGNGRSPSRTPGAVLELTTTPASSAPILLARPARAHVFPHGYDVHGLVSIASDVRLKELEHFRVGEVVGGPDLEIRIGPVGTTGPRGRVSVLETPGHVSYHEHLGLMGANFRLDMGDRINVLAGPMLARSPHVLYTNVVEALLRFVLASRGRILLHSATIELDGRGVMLSARTDTGKTGTVLRLLQREGARFLSDDMTILDERGVALSYPKPLTISAHTLRAVDMQVLGRGRRAALAVQSRVHSREGRSVGQRLAQMNLPIMALNAVAQVLVPPPKYQVNRLVRCELAGETTVRHLFLIERGRPALEEVDGAAAVRTLIENTDDAYGFPPFRSFAPSITLGGDDYLSLRAKEHRILRAALDHMVIRRIASDDFSWADTIAGLLEVRAGTAGTPVLS
jgi:dolichol-phosphate mannosyltransferase